MDHVYKKCSCGDEQCCPICSWGALICAVCGGAEGELQHECPGRLLTPDEHDEYFHKPSVKTISHIRPHWVPGRDL